MKLFFATAAEGPSGKKVTVNLITEQLINSAIVAGIAGMATWTGMAPDFMIMGKAFVITFLIELRKYRKL